MRNLIKQNFKKIHMSVQAFAQSWPWGSAFIASLQWRYGFGFMVQLVRGAMDCLSLEV